MMSSFARRGCSRPGCAHARPSPRVIGARAHVRRLERLIRAPFAARGGVIGARAPVRRLERLIGAPFASRAAARLTAGRMNFVQISRSVRLRLSIAQGESFNC